MAAIPPAIARLSLHISAEALAASNDAATEIARFDAELGGEIAPFATVLLHSESAASSRIENLTASARAISETLLGKATGRNAGAVVGNVEAMQAAIALADDITCEAILEMHRALLTRTDPPIAGVWRGEQVWIGGSALGPHRADFVPPLADRLEPQLADLVAFCARTDLPVLAHTAVAHAQFETVHPFADGNGRTGRALMHAMLRHHGLVRNVTIPISAGLLGDVDNYFDALTAYRKGNPEPIIDRLSEATHAAITNGHELVGDLRGIRAGWNERIRARRDSSAWRIADLVVRNPVINADLIARELAIAPQNTYRSVAPLLEAEVLVRSGRERDRVWRSPEVLQAVDAFAERAGRRARSGGG